MHFPTFYILKSKINSSTLTINNIYLGELVHQYGGWHRQTIELRYSLIGDKPDLGKRNYCLDNFDIIEYFCTKKDAEKYLYTHVFH